MKKTSALLLRGEVALEIERLTEQVTLAAFARYVHSNDITTAATDSVEVTNLNYCKCHFKLI
jgi:hypothetical protein